MVSFKTKKKCFNVLITKITLKTLMYKISTIGLSLTPLFVTTLAVDAAIEPDFHKIKILSLHSPQLPLLIKGK